MGYKLTPLASTIDWTISLATLQYSTCPKILHHGVFPAGRSVPLRSCSQQGLLSSPRHVYLVAAV